METSSKPWQSVTLSAVLGFLLAIFVSTLGASPGQRSATHLLAVRARRTAVGESESVSRATALSDQRRDLEQREASSVAPFAPGRVLEVFTNTWAQFSVGLAYDPGRDHVWYAHESQSGGYSDTVCAVGYPVPHPVLGAFALSDLNPGWPQGLDNRTGAGYDSETDTYFLADYDGDWLHADDNIVEITPEGVILNAWRMDDEVGSNDSADGSKIDKIIDIAVVPGVPTRYFVTAADGDSLVYEIDLMTTGIWWSPDSWHTVTTCTVPGLNDNWGIDYDAFNKVLYHSGRHTTTIVVTDLSCNVQMSFDCPGAGGYNSGLAFIEGTWPPEIWVTDFSSDTTTRCEAVGKKPLFPGWEKWVDGQVWGPDLLVARQTLEAIHVTDVVTAVESFTLTDSWDPARLALVDVDVLSAAAGIITAPGSLEIVGHAGPAEVVTVTKWFRVQPCDWFSTTLQEELVVDGEPPFEARTVNVVKQVPELWIHATLDESVYAGHEVTFSLVYSNVGGYESDAWIEARFPPEAVFISSVPDTSDRSSDGMWARWNLGALGNEARGTIDVTVAVSDVLAPGDWVAVTSVIHNHAGEAIDETAIGLAVACKPIRSGTLSCVHTGEIYVDTAVHFQVDFAPEDATRPYTYTVTWGDGGVDMGTSSADPLSLDHTFDASGLYTVALVAWNCSIVDPVTDVVTVSVQAPAACVDASVDDLRSSSPAFVGESMIFTATVSGEAPLVYSWDFEDDGTPDLYGPDQEVVSHYYGLAGDYVAVLDVTNQCPSIDSDFIQVVVLASEPGERSLYLPLVIRSLSSPKRTWRW